MTIVRKEHGNRFHLLNLPQRIVSVMVTFHVLLETRPSAAIGYGGLAILLAIGCKLKASQGLADD